MHDGAFTQLADAIRHHLNPATSLPKYDPTAQGLPHDLSGPIGPVAALIDALDMRVVPPLTFEFATTP